MNQKRIPVFSARSTATVALAAVIGIAIGAAGNRVVAQMAAPTDHIGVSVEPLGTVSEESLKAQIGLDRMSFGYWGNGK